MFTYLKKTKNEVLEIPEGHLCCGSAGTYNILQPEIAKKLLNNKVGNIEKNKTRFYFNRKYFIR